MLVATLLVVAGSSQSAAVAKTPAGSLPDAAALRAQGVRVSWPLRTVTASLVPGTVLRVQVKPVGSRKRRTVRLAFVRTTAAGRPLRTLFSQRLRRGTFTAVVPGPVGATHHLMLTVGRRVYRSVITTTATPVPAPIPAIPGASGAASDYSVPMLPGGGSYAPPPNPVPWCADAGVAGMALRIGTPQVAPGGTVSFEATNTGQRCMVPPLIQRVERLEGASWVDVGYSSSALSGQYFLPPGDLYSGTVTLFPGTVPGRHRLIFSFRVALAETTVVDASAEFDVVAP